MMARPLVMAGLVLAGLSLVVGCGAAGDSATETTDAVAASTVVSAATSSSSAASTTVATTKARSASLTPLQISDRFGDAVVKVVVSGCGGPGYGSGVAIHHRRVVTAAHVVETTNTPTLQLRDGTLIPGKVIGRNVGLDVAVIEAAPKSFPTTVKWGDGEAVREGSALTIIGYPNSPDPRSAGAYDVVPVVVRSVVDGGSHFETSEGPDRGDSGGPAFNDRGRPVGLLVLGGKTDAASYAYVVSSSMVEPAVQAMIDRRVLSEPTCPAPPATAPATPPVARPAPKQQSPSPTPSPSPSSRLGEEYRGTWIAQVSSLPLDGSIDKAKSELARFLALDPGFTWVLSIDWPATFDRADRVIIIRGGYGSRQAAEAACAGWGLRVPDDCLTRLLI